jgi:hypothetical protein
MLWYAAERIVRQALNRRYLNELKPYFVTVATKEATVSLPNSSTIDDQKSITIAEYVFHSLFSLISYIYFSDGVKIIFFTLVTNQSMQFRQS